MALPDHEHLDAGVKAVLTETLDVARATAEGRAKAGDLEPFALVHAGGDLRLVLLGDVAHALADPQGTGRVASTLLQRYGADAFAIATVATASPDGSPEHPQAREVMRVIVGHADGTSGSTWCELGGGGLSGLWETGG